MPTTIVRPLRASGQAPINIPRHPLWTGLIASWRMNSEAVDYVHGLALNVDVGTSYVAGKLGNALSCPTTLGAQVTSDLFNFQSSPWSMQLWYKRAATATVLEYVVGYVSGHGDIAWAAVDNGTNLVVQGDPGGNGWAISGASPANNTWTHIVFTTDGIGSWDLYLNGVQTHDGNQGSLPDFAGNVLFIGNDAGDGPTSSETVIVDMVSIWNRKLTDAEAATLYNSGAGLDPTTLY